MAASGLAVIEDEDVTEVGAVDDESLLELGNIAGEEDYHHVKIGTDFPNIQRHLTPSARSHTTVPRYLYRSTWHYPPGRT